MCEEILFLSSLLIPGPSAMGNNIDIYLQPLIYDLNDLWEVRIMIYDASVKRYFQLRASLMWTIINFLGYANLLGWSTKVALVCPIRHKIAHSQRLKHGGNFFYGHRRFLDRDYKFRNNARLFYGIEEYRGPPHRLSGIEFWKK